MSLKLLFAVPSLGIYFQREICRTLQQIRLQSTGSFSRSADWKSFKEEWLNARPYEDIPTVKNFKSILSFLPGGKYYKISPMELVMTLKRDLGNIVKFDGTFGRQDMVITHNAEDFITVFRNEGTWPERPTLLCQQYHRNVYRADFFDGVEGIISTQGEKWAKFRSAVNPVLMQPKNVRLYMHKMSQVNKEFVERIREIRDPNTLEVPSSFDEEINRWTLESISVVAIDKQLGLISKNREDPLVKELFQAMIGFFKYAANIEYGPPFWKIYRTKSFKELLRSLDSITFITSKYVNESIQRIQQEISKSLPEKPDHDKSVLEKLIKIDKKIATVMAMDMLMAGVDTTASTFAGLLLCLAKNPSKQAKLREEVIRILPNKDSEFTEESMRAAPYLRACIKESLRMYPIVIGNTRAPVNDVILSGYRVPKGTPVTLAFIALLDDDTYFPRAKEYLPERWLRADKNSLECPQHLKPSNPFIYLPFGFGPRSCVGRRIVEMELELGITRVIRNFKVEYNYSTDNAFESLLINKPRIPLTFKFTDIEK